MLNFFKKKKKEPENLKEVLAQFKELKENFEKISVELENLKKKNKFNIQKTGIVRFNPFKEVGSDQSFSIALLDGNDSGVVITSLYAREENRVYGKPIKAGISEYLLSEEEKQAIAQAREISVKDSSETASHYVFQPECRHKTKTYFSANSKVKNKTKHKNGKNNSKIKRGEGRE